MEDTIITLTIQGSMMTMMDDDDDEGRPGPSDNDDDDGNGDGEDGNNFSRKLDFCFVFVCYYPGRQRSVITLLCYYDVIILSNIIIYGWRFVMMAHGEGIGLLVREQFLG